jgi:hypothetical protein
MSTQEEGMQMGRLDDATARWIGLGVFLLGIAFLILVFVLAYRDLTGAGVLGRLSGPPPAVEGRAAVEASAALQTLAIKGVLFFLMAYVGSAVAGRGIGMYGASRAPHEV